MLLRSCRFVGPKRLSLWKQINALHTPVSKFYEVDKAEIMKVVDGMKTEYRQKEEGGTIEIKECKLCEKKNKSAPDNLWKLNIRPNGSFNCYRCEGCRGSWFDLKKRAADKFGYTNVQDGMSEKSTSSSIPKAKSKVVEEIKKKYTLPNQNITTGHHRALFPLSSTSPVDPNVAFVKKYLNETRGLDDTVLARYGVGFSTQGFLSDDAKGDYENHLCVTFPWMVTQSELDMASIESDSINDAIATLQIEGVDCVATRTKFRSLVTKGKQRILPKGGMWGLFGWHLVRPEDKQLVITEGEYDAMAVAQGLAALPDNDPLRIIPVVSLPNGCNSLPTELIPLLERFTKIYLWMDNDKSGIDATEKFAKKLGLTRCLVVRPHASSKIQPKDANDALRSGVPDLIPTLMRAARMQSHAKIQTFVDLRDQVFASIRRVDQREGSQVESMPQLCKLCKGFRKGELVIFTGPTGSGKTTLLSQISLDFAKSGAPTLWGSFEIKNHRLVHKMLQQSYKYGSLSLIEDDKLQQIANDFETLPLQFMNFHGGTPIDEIIDAMEYAVYKDDVQHIIIDNLQFMMPRASLNGGGSKNAFEKFDFQDAVIDKFRRFATEKNVCVVVVIHPRKEDDATSLGISSIFGTAKATQEADLVLILQKNKDNLMSLDVKKNRYDGMLGRVQLDFNPTSLCFVESDRPPPQPQDSKPRYKAPQ